MRADSASALIKGMMRGSSSRFERPGEKRGGHHSEGFVWCGDVWMNLSMSTVVWLGWLFVTFEPWILNLGEKQSATRCDRCIGMELERMIWVGLVSIGRMYGLGSFSFVLGMTSVDSQGTTTYPFAWWALRHECGPCIDSLGTNP